MQYIMEVVFFKCSSSRHWYDNIHVHVRVGTVAHILVVVIGVVLVIVVVIVVVVLIGVVDQVGNNIGSNNTSSEVAPD